MMKHLRQLKERLDLECPVCGGEELEPVFYYNKPPVGEHRYSFGKEKSYERWFCRCGSCGHFAARHEFDLSDLYKGDYVESLYESADGIRQRFDKIVSLPNGKSDNRARVVRVKRWFDQPGKVLDVGSGLCVFLHGMKQAGWQGTALDPDERAVRHASDVVGVKAICADFMVAENIGRFQLVTFNKVLEHVEDPLAMLCKAQENTEKEGLVYVEVPDGETAAREGADRQEFFVEHWHAFSVASLAMLMQRAGYIVKEIDRLREPSGKYTLWACGYSARQ